MESTQQINRSLTPLPLSRSNGYAAQAPACSQPYYVCRTLSFFLHSKRCAFPCIYYCSAVDRGNIRTSMASTCSMSEGVIPWQTLVEILPFHEAVFVVYINPLTGSIGHSWIGIISSWRIDARPGWPARASEGLMLSS